MSEKVCNKCGLYSYHQVDPCRCLVDDMNAFNQLEVIRLNKRVKELKGVIYVTCVEYYIASGQELLEGMPSNFIASIVEMEKVHNSDQ